MHTLLDLHGNIPTFLRVTNGDVHDVNILAEITPDAGAFYIMDRAYVDFRRLARRLTLWCVGRLIEHEGAAGHREFAIPQARIWRYDLKSGGRRPTSRIQFEIKGPFLVVELHRQDKSPVRLAVPLPERFSAFQGDPFPIQHKNISLAKIINAAIRTQANREAIAVLARLLKLVVRCFRFPAIPPCRRPICPYCRNGHRSLWRMHVLSLVDPTLDVYVTAFLSVLFAAIRSTFSGAYPRCFEVELVGFLDPPSKRVSDVGRCSRSRKDLAIKRPFIRYPIRPFWIFESPKLRSPAPHIAFLAACQRFRRHLGFYFGHPIYRFNLPPAKTIHLLLETSFGIFRSWVCEAKWAYFVWLLTVLVRNELSEKRLLLTTFRDSYGAIA